MSHVTNTSATNSSHWLMVLLCFLPLAGLAAVFVFNLPISSVVLVALILACPIIHFVIMHLDGHSSLKHNPKPATTGVANHRRDS